MRQYSKELAEARSKYWGWQILCKLAVGILYLSVVSEGLRLAFPVLSLKIHKMPIPVAAGLMARDDNFHRFDAAHLVAFAFMFAVFFTWVRVLKEWMSPYGVEDIWAKQQRQILFGIGGVIILAADSFCFYYGVLQLGWGGGLFSFPALVGTVAYATGLIICAFISLDLGMRVQYHKENQR